MNNLKSKAFIIATLFLSAMYAPSMGKNFVNRYFHKPTAWEVYCKVHGIDPTKPTEEQEAEWEIFQETDEYQELIDEITNHNG